MKKIALDLDGVVFDTENLYRVYTEIYDVDHLKKDSLVDNSQRIYQKRYNWPEEEYENFYKKYAKKVLKTGNIMSGADVVIPKLLTDYEFIVVTSRSDEEVQYAKDFFSSIGLKNITIYNGEVKKIDKLIEEHVDYIIDDDQTICLEASKHNIHALYFKNNASFAIEENKYLKIVHNWGEIYKFLMFYQKR